MDDLSKKLNNVNAGCFMGTALINNLMYADGLVILAPSHVGKDIHVPSFELNDNYTAKS